MDKLKTKVQNADWWEIGYLIIYGAIFTYEFLNTTMFEIQWPPRFGYIFIAASALYTIAKFIWHNTYTKKEMILSGIILFAFIMPSILTDYSFLWWVGFLIVGAKDVDFKKILKVYLVIGITIMVIAFAASQYGLIEDLQYITIRGEETYTRHAYGIIYPTDFAAHVFYMVLAVLVYFDHKLSMICKCWICILASVCVYMVANAQTSTLCLWGCALLCVFERVFRKYMNTIGKFLRWIPVVCAIVFCSLAYMYNPATGWMVKLNELLSTRLEISKKAFDMYEIKWFGQYIPEIGSGMSIEYKPDYFFLDDVYIRILLEYGLVLFVVVLLMLVMTSRNAIAEQNYLLVISLVVIAVHSIMEHHLLETAYNPIILALFASISDKKQCDRRETCTEKIAKAG